MKTLPIPTVALTSSTSSVFVGQPVTFTATVQPASGNSTPTGYVAFNFLQVERSDAEGLGVGFGPWSIVDLNGSGVATFTTSALQALETPVNAFYLGDANNAPAAATMTQTVSDIPTTTTVTASANNVPYGTPVVFTITVQETTGKPASGWVSIVEGGIAFATPNLNSAGQAMWTNGTGAGSLPPGTDTITVEFFPDTYEQKSTGTLIETFIALGTTSDPVLSPPAGTYTAAEQVTLGDSTSGAIVYYTTDGSTPVPGVSPGLIAGYALKVGASETITTVAVAPGYYASSVVSATYTINLPPPDFSLSLAPQAITVYAGGSATTQVSVSALNGFTQSVSLSCSGLPAGVTCALAPANVTGTGGSTLTIAASASASVTTGPADSSFVPLTALGAVLGCLCIRRRRIGLPMLVACTLSLLALTGCGGGGSYSGSSSKSTVSTVSVTGTSGSLSHSVTLTLTLTQ
jgi:hypothetical protein